MRVSNRTIPPSEFSRSGRLQRKIPKTPAQDGFGGPKISRPPKPRGKMANGANPSRSEQAQPGTGDRNGRPADRGRTQQIAQHTSVAGGMQRRA